MIHYTYITKSINGKYYVGRHSTDNIDDGYFGSGKWVRSIKDKSRLNKEILEYYDSFESLKEAECTLISQHIDDPLCMNYNNSSIGFGTGDYNPGRRSDLRESSRIRFMNDNPSKREEVKKKISDSLKGRSSPLKGKKLTEEARLKISESRRGIKYSDEGRAKLSEARKKNVEQGKVKVPSFDGLSHSEETIERMRHNALNRQSIECPHCKLSYKPHMFKRWHGDNCRMKDS